MAHLPLIALDGPSGVGKSTTAKRVALDLGWGYLDTGAMFRAIALALQRAGLSLEPGAALDAFLQQQHVAQQGSQIFLNDEDVSEAIRSPEVTRTVSQVSADPRVRQKLLEQQRRIGAQGNWVVDGRDIGTVVFPQACCKIFLTANVATRAQRRLLELQKKGSETSLEEVICDIQQRDYLDSTRLIAPLKKAPDAVELDSSQMSFEEVVDWIVRHHRRHA